MTFSYDGDEYVLRSIRRLSKRLPTGRLPDVGRPTRTVELRGKGKEVLYRRGIDHLTPATMEYPTGDPARPLARVKGPRRRDVSILVPAVPGALSLAVVEASPPGKKTRAGAEGDRRDALVVELPREGGPE